MVAVVQLAIMAAIFIGSAYLYDWKKRHPGEGTGEAIKRWLGGLRKDLGRDLVGPSAEGLDLHRQEVRERRASLEAEIAEVMAELAANEQYDADSYRVSRRMMAEMIVHARHGLPR